jgi:hypothetical protein
MPHAQAEVIISCNAIHGSDAELRAAGAPAAEQAELPDVKSGHTSSVWWMMPGFGILGRA